MRTQKDIPTIGLNIASDNNIFKILDRKSTDEIHIVFDGAGEGDNYFITNYENLLSILRNADKELVSTTP